MDERDLTRNSQDMGERCPTVDRPTTAAQNLTPIAALHRALDEKNLKNLPRITITSISKDDVMYQDPETLETVYHKCAKFSRLDDVEEVMRHCLKLDRSALFTPDRHGAPSFLVAICHSSNWFLSIFLLPKGLALRRPHRRLELLPMYGENNDDPLGLLEWMLSSNVVYAGTEFERGSGLLHIAVKARKPNVIRKLLRANRQRFFRDSRGKTCVDLALACKLYAPEVLSCFTSGGDVLLHLVDANSSTDPSVAEEILRILFENGADASYSSVDEFCCPLYLAIKSRNYGVANTLINHGAHVSGINFPNRYHDDDEATYLRRPFHEHRGKTCRSRGRKFQF